MAVYSSYTSFSHAGCYVFRVVVVGGDGIVHEVVNGLLEKSHKNVGIDLVDGILPEKFTVLPLNVPIGIIPAGMSLKFFCLSLLAH